MIMSVLVKPFIQVQWNWLFTHVLIQCYNSCQRYWKAKSK